MTTAAEPAAPNRLMDRACAATYLATARAGLVIPFVVTFVVLTVISPKFTRFENLARGGSYGPEARE